jgi:hypothetical protein
MNNFLDINFFGNNQFELIAIAGSFIGVILLAGVLLYLGLYLWDKSERRPKVFIQPKSVERREIK